MKRIHLILCAVATLLVAGVAVAYTGGTTKYPGLIKILATKAGPTCTTASGDGSLCAQGDVETDDDLLVGDDATISGDLAVSGGATITGAVTLNGAYNVPAAYTITFDEGASKGLALLQLDGTVFDTTAGLHNHMMYGGAVLNVVNIATATATQTPTAEATGVDITQGAGDNDNITLFGGVLGASGRPFVVGTDAAFKFCQTVKIHDVSGTDSFFCGFRTLDVAVAIGSYTDYAAIGNVSGDIKVTDKTTGDTDTTDNWADDATKTTCTLVSATGVVTYTIGGAAPTVTDAHTLGDGLLVVPFCQLLNDAHVADDTHLTSWAVSFQ